MIQNLIHPLLKRRHYWRHIDFDELSELYTSSMLRGIGLSLIGIFIPIYLYELGHSVSSILLFFAGVFIVRTFAGIPAAYCVAWIGPKHTMLLGNIMQVVTLVLLLAPTYYVVPLWLIVLCFGVASSLYFLAYHVDFSKILHEHHGGKEIGFMSIVERVGGVAGPVVGGIVAAVFGAEYTIIIAAVLLIFATVPLFLSEEPTRRHQKLEFRLLNYSQLKWDFVSWSGAALENNIIAVIWPLSLAVTVFSLNAYAGVGLITSVATIAAIAAAKLIGTVVDRNQGGALLKYSALSFVVVNALRPFVTTYAGAIITNILYELVFTGYRIPFMKGMYDRADKLPGYRIVYLAIMELYGDIAKVVVFILLWVVAITWDDHAALTTAFIIAAVSGIFISMQRFPALRR